MNIIFVNDCAVDGCYKKNIGKGKQMCKEHQAEYEAGNVLKAFYGKTVKKQYKPPLTPPREGNKNQPINITMKQFLITNPAFSGEAIAIYNNDGLLIKFDVSDTNMSAAFVTHFKRAVPAQQLELRAAFKPDTVIVENEVVVPFEQFWLKYDHKYNKDRTETLWKRLSKTDQVLAFFALARYFKYLRKHPTQAKLHPDTYLRNKAWLNEY
jgi:hypothetical protein